MENSIDSVSVAGVTNEVLRSGAETFERFWLQPERFQNQEVTVRLRLNKKLGGWKIKDELVESLGLKVGECISTEVSVQFGPEIIDDDGDTDLFADGDAADWLVDTVLHNGQRDGTVKGCIIDCVVRLAYDIAPVGQSGKKIHKASLILVKGLAFCGYDVKYLQRESKFWGEELFSQLRDD